METPKDHPTLPLSRQRAILLKQARLLIPRLERLPPDSSWARRASGCRGTLLRHIEHLESGSGNQERCFRDNTETSDLVNLRRAIDQGFTILNAAAKEQLSY
jgi:hypothetical protein